jgi:hypothetical protein
MTITITIFEIRKQLHQQLGLRHQVLKAGFGTTFGESENLRGMFGHRQVRISKTSRTVARLAPNTETKNSCSPI